MDGKGAWAFAVAVFVLLVWALSGPLFGFSDTRQLVINTGTTIVTFLMVFLIQHSGNRNSRALQMKLDELISARPAAWRTSSAPVPTGHGPVRQPNRPPIIYAGSRRHRRRLITNDVMTSIQSLSAPQPR